MCHKPYAADETRHNSIDSNARWRGKPAATIFFISLLGHDVYDRAGTYGRFGRCAINRMLLIINGLYENPECSAGIQGEIKNGGYSHDVIENTCRKNVILARPHDVDENKQHRSYRPRCV